MSITITEWHRRICHQVQRAVALTSMAHIAINYLLTRWI
jgi:hypothetical protein